ncbi:uroplakin-3b-like [Rhea pennata]|uniref:uroplakin-3b-like n=1 Tax=Rhea pennata TaxID=8795 RepID=UPI002E26FE0A
MELLRVLLALAGTGAAAGLALLPYVPRVPRQPLAGKVTATTFALDKPFCVFDGYTNATDGVWLAVVFANASAAFRNPASTCDIPPYRRLRAALGYMTLETPAAAYACGSRSAAVLRVGGEAACGAARGPASCNGPLPSPGPYRVKFVALGPRGPTAETLWSEPIALRQARSPGTLERGVAGRGASAALVMASVLAGLGAALAAGLFTAVRARARRPERPLQRRLPAAAGSFARRSYRTHHIPPAAPRPPGACPARAPR